MKSKWKYEIIIYWRRINPISPRFRELPGCAADGKTYRQAVGNAEVVIQEWIDTAKELGRPLPGPKGRLAYA